MSDSKFTTAEQCMQIDYSVIPAFVRTGGAYDRGAADSYYGRERDPHYFSGGSQKEASEASIRLDAADLSAEEIAAYNQGYDHYQAINRTGARGPY